MNTKCLQSVVGGFLSLFGGEKDFITRRLLLAALATACSITSAQARVTWDFEDGTMQGWTNRMASPNLGLSFTNTVEFATWSGDPDYGNAALGAYFLAQTYIYSEAHQSLWVQSPPFKLDGTGDLTFRGMGAQGADISVTNVPAESSSEGTCAVCLRRDDGTFVLTRHVGGETSTFDVYRFTAAELAPYANDGHWYTVDVVDTYSGTYPSFIAIDNVSVPGVPAGFVAFNFEDGTKQGWTNLMVSSASAGYYDLAFGAAQQAGSTYHGNSSRDSFFVPFWSTIGTPGSNPVPGGGSYFLGELPLTNYSVTTDWASWPTNGCGAHQTLCVQSPAFSFNTNGDLTYSGWGSSANVPLTTYAALMPIAGTWGGDSGNPAATQGTCTIGLLRDDGVFVLYKDFLNDLGLWTNYTIAASELSEFVNDGHTYTLNMIDMWSGRNSSCAIDNIAIPGTLVKRSQTITGFGTLTNRPSGTYDIAMEFPSISASSGLPVQYTISGPSASMTNSIATLGGQGSVTITATQPGNDYFEAAAPVVRTFTVTSGKIFQYITFSAIPNHAYGDSFTITATSSYGLPVSLALSGSATLDGNVVTCTNGMGTVTITATQAGNDTVSAATPVIRSFAVLKGTQTITFEAIPDQHVGNTVALVATASSGLPVSFVVSGPATLSGNSLTCTGVGTVTVTASQEGNASVDPAAPVARSFAVKDIMTFDWNNGTMQGWTNTMVSTAVANYYDLSFGPAIQTGHDNWGEGPYATWNVPGTTEHISPTDSHVIPGDVGAYFLGALPWENQIGVTVWANWPEPSSGAQQTIMAQSPAFRLNTSGDLTYYGCGNSQGVPLTSLSAIPEIGGTWGTDSGNPADTKGSCAVGLLRDDGVFVLSKDFLGIDAWRTYTFTTQELAPYIGDGHSYRLALVDFWSGRNAWCAIDNVSIPGTPLVAPITAPTLHISLKADKTKLVITYSPTVAGQTCNLVSSDVVTRPTSSWTSVSAITNAAGSTSVEIPLPATKTFYMIKY